MRFAAIVVVASVLTLCGGANAGGDARWVVRDLGGLPGARTTEALAVSDGGDVVGWSSTNRAFLWRQGRLRDLGAGYAVDVNERGQVLVDRDTTGIARVWKEGGTTLLRPEPRGSCLSSLGRAINDSGVAVGWTANRDCQGLTMSISWQAARWAGGARTLLSGRRRMGPGDSEAVAVNERGQILVESEGGGSYVWTDGRVTFLPGRAAWLDDKGRVAGSTATASRPSRAYLWSGGKRVLLAPLPGFTESSVDGMGRTGDMNFATSYPRIIDGAGDVVGVSATYSTSGGGRCRSVMWIRGRAIDLTGFSSKFCIQPVVNSAGVVAGTVDRSGTVERAFVWENGKFGFLPTLGGTSAFAGAINDRGQIVGSATTRGGVRHAVMWTRG